MGSLRSVAGMKSMSLYDGWAAEIARSILSRLLALTCVVLLGLPPAGCRQSPATGSPSPPPPAPRPGSPLAPPTGPLRDQRGPEPATGGLDVRHVPDPCESV